jgi:tol-pal system protein YbgF
MKTRALILLLASYSIAHAETWELPPVIDNSGYPPQTATINPVTPAAPSSNALYEMMGRLEQLQKEVQLLTGKVEEQAHLIGELKKQQKVMYSDFDDRLQSIENKGSATAEPPAPASDTAPPPPAEAPAAEPEKKLVPPPPPVSAAEPQSAPAKKAEPKPANPPAVAKAPPAAPPQPQVPAEEKQDYDAALNALRTGKNVQAIDAFNAYLQKYPTSHYSAHAQLHLGEAYHLNNNDDAARKAFHRLIEHQAKSDKVADALLMLGTIELEQKHSDKARDYLTRVSTEYPNSSAAQRAAKKLEKLAQ